MMLRRGLAVSALLGAVCAQSSTTSADKEVISVFMIGAVGGGTEDNPDPLYASIIDNDETATTMMIGCDQIPGNEDDTCNYFSGFTVINGPSTFEAGYGYGGTNMTMGCEIIGSTTATCSQEITALEYMQTADSPMVTETQPDIDTTALTTSATTTTLASSELSWYPVTITAGALKTGDEAAAGSSTTGSGAASSTGSASSAGADGTSDAGRIALKASGVLAGFAALVMML